MMKSGIHANVPALRRSAPLQKMANFEKTHKAQCTEKSVRRLGLRKEAQQIGAGNCWASYLSPTYSLYIRLFSASRAVGCAEARSASIANDALHFV